MNKIIRLHVWVRFFSRNHCFWMQPIYKCTQMQSYLNFLIFYIFTFFAMLSIFCVFCLGQSHFTVLWMTLQWSTNNFDTAITESVNKHCNAPDYICIQPVSGIVCYVMSRLLNKPFKIRAETCQNMCINYSSSGSDSSSSHG